jgi:phosphatidate cytidylyltransferase
MVCFGYDSFWYNYDYQLINLKTGHWLFNSESMIRTIYIIILAYFLLAAIAFYLINRRKEPAVARNSWIKLATYFLIINVLFFCIVFFPLGFRLVVGLIILMGFYELTKLFMASGFRKKRFFWIFMSLFTLFAVGFFFFSGLDKGLILFTFLIICIFDGFSQITGQLFGRTKLFPRVSPQKTVEGLIGGALIAIFSAIIIEGLIEADLFKAMRMAFGIAVFAFIGDVAASWYKRQFGVKDFSNFIPGHGGFLDRFDSLIGGGAWIAFLEFFVY